MVVWKHAVLVAVSIVGGDEEISVVDGVVTVYRIKNKHGSVYNDYNLQYMTASDYKHTHLR